jgi:hypothetical protein
MQSKSPSSVFCASFAPAALRVDHPLEHLRRHFGSGDGSSRHDDEDDLRRADGIFATGRSVSKK